ncbi:MAG: hypothetical protein A2637_03495 [Candidatus Muproteobacteria bacterium RIFCSPHIGHO2_01_FULL_65_16]|uniref:Uncharacterized protein n=1 Tax=Candidatus Muproteobacteria bacterium RIFCSPHIGHO2_01_FULL_65_16 TaxID=1817764 RepID=A0A1F6TH09_9PROT|nr:MAG: hypothetical protein A2637_03495 [Candidatus Muproteobacteria bacterium RIFCSPHIGHO2_01_FULL_65_16]
MLAGSCSPPPHFDGAEGDFDGAPGSGGFAGIIGRGGGGPFGDDCAGTSGTPSSRPLWGGRTTMVGMVAVLLAVAGSCSMARTLAVFVSVRVSVTRRTTVIGALVRSAARLPRLQVSVAPAWVQLAGDETSVTAGGVAVGETGIGVGVRETPVSGRLSITTTLVAGEGPLLVTVSWYVTSLPCSPETIEAVFTSDRSADGLTVVVAIRELFDV